MFIVYSPEGQSFIGVPPPKPTLRVDPVHPARPVQEMGEESERVQFDQKGGAFKKARSASTSPQETYQAIQTSNDRHRVVKVGEIMSAPVVTALPHHTVAELWALMQKSQIHALPIIELGVLKGLVTVRQLWVAWSESQSNDFMQWPAERIMQQKVITTRALTEIRRVAYVMSAYDLTAMPVMSEQNEIVGIVTRKDLIERLAEEPPLELYT